MKEDTLGIVEMRPRELTSRNSEVAFIISICFNWLRNLLIVLELKGSEWGLFLETKFRTSGNDIRVVEHSCR